MNNKIKYILSSLLVLITLIIIKIVLQDTEIIGDLLPELFILFIISILMIIVPFIFRLIAKEKIKYKKGKLLCFLNSFIIYILFLIPNLIAILKRNDNLEVMSMDPVAFSKSLIVAFLFIAIIYYFINMFLFVDNKNRLVQLVVFNQPCKGILLADPTWGLF